MLLNDQSTWPEDVVECLERHRANLEAYDEVDRQHEAEVQSGDYDIEKIKINGNPHFGDYENAKSDVLLQLQNHQLTGWHCTKLTDFEIDSIRSLGMRLPNGALLLERIDLLCQQGSIDEPFAAKLKSKHLADDDNRKDRIWFCFFHPCRESQGGIERFFRYWGGESLYRCHERDDEARAHLMKTGTPVVVEAAVPVSSFGTSFLGQHVLRRFLRPEGDHGEEFEACAKSPIAREQISRIILFGTKEFDELTGCQGWSPPLG